MGHVHFCVVLLPPSTDTFTGAVEGRVGGRFYTELLSQIYTEHLIPGRSTPERFVPHSLPWLWRKQMPVSLCGLWGRWWFLHLCSKQLKDLSLFSSEIFLQGGEKYNALLWDTLSHGRTGWTHPCVWIQNGQDTWNTTHLAVLRSLKYFQIRVQSYFSPVQKDSLKLRNCILGTKLGWKLHPPQFSEHVGILPWTGTAETTKKVLSIKTLKET